VEASKPIRLSAHAKSRVPARGASEEEVFEAIRTTSWSPAARGCLECRRDFPFCGEWNGRKYGTKQVRPIFMDLPAELLVVTVYVYFF
jgi:hypothetical protein